MYKNRFENPESDEMTEIRRQTMELPADIMNEKAKVLLGTINVSLYNLEDIKFHVSNGDTEIAEAVNQKKQQKNIIDDHYNLIKIMLDTGKIDLDEIISVVGEKNQERIKELFEVGALQYLVNHGLN